MRSRIPHNFRPVRKLSLAQWKFRLNPSDSKWVCVKFSGNTRNLNGWLSLIIVLPIGPLKSITSCAPDDWRINLPPVTRHWSCNFRSSWSARGQIHGWNLAYCQWYWEIVFIQFDQVFVHSNHSTRYIRDYINEFRECFFYYFPGMPSWNFTQGLQRVNP